MAFKILRYVPSIPTLCRVLIKKGCCILSNAFSASRGFYGSCSFIFSFFIFFGDFICLFHREIESTSRQRQAEGEGEAGWSRMWGSIL